MGTRSIEIGSAERGTLRRWPLPAPGAGSTTCPASARADRGLRADNLRARHRAAWLLVLWLGLHLSACKATAGGRCGSEGEARCDGAGQMLVCMAGKWSAVACAGPKGCVRSGRFVDCDESVARAGDPCADGTHAHACTADGSALLRCDGTTWAPHRICRGPKRCTSSARFADCDDSIAEEGDACDEGQRSCSADGAKLLLCAKGKITVESTCTPQRCRANDGYADCE